MPPAGGRKEEIQTKNVHHLHIELTPAQYELLRQNAEKAGLSRRAYLMNLLEGTPIRARPEEELKKLRTEVHQSAITSTRLLGVPTPVLQSRRIFSVPVPHGQSV